MSLLPETWPEDVRDAVGEVVGDVRGSERLSGLSGREVRRVDGSRGRVVVKREAHPRELAFYLRVAPKLTSVAVPTVPWSDGETWLVLEHVPRPLPRELWNSPQVYDVLAALHTSTTAYAVLPDPFRPEWTDAMTQTAREVLGLDLAGLQHETAPLLTGDTPVSADPNPRNWAMRDDGELVLFDWERAGFATPGLDVAITLPGLPDLHEAESAAATYRRARADPTLLPRTLLLLKLWTALELLSEERDDEGLRATQKWLAESLPAWLESWA